MVSHDFFFPYKFVWPAISLLPLTPQNFILLLSWCQWISATPESFSTRSSRWYYCPPFQLRSCNKPSVSGLLPDGQTHVASLHQRPTCHELLFRKALCNRPYRGDSP